MARETINSEVQLVFRKKTRGQVIGAELQEGFAHIGVAAHEAGRLAAEQLGPRVAAAREAAGPTLDAAQKAAAVKVAPKVAAAVAVAAPAVASARDAVGPRVEAARDALHLESLAPRLEAARDAAAPRVASAVTAAQAAAAKAAADLAPHVEAAQKAAQKALKDDVVPRLEAAQTAALAYALPRAIAARDAVTPALESAKEALAAGVDSARSELEARRAEVAAAAAESTRKARRPAKKARKTAIKKHRELEKKVAATATQVRLRTGAQATPRRWPWVFAALAVGTAVFVLLRRKKTDAWTPAPAGEGPVPSYREDPVPSSPSSSSDADKTVSTAMDTPNDGSPPESDMGVRDAQLAEGDGPDAVTPPEDTAPQPFSSGGGTDEGPTAGPDDKQV
jgi:hypothetical protein